MAAPAPGGIRYHGDPVGSSGGWSAAPTTVTGRLTVDPRNIASVLLVSRWQAPDRPVSNKPDNALKAILQDLETGQRVRRTHFLPAALLAAVVVIGILVSMNVRPDLLEQPAGQLAVQIGMWILCLLVMPAIGVGLLFPGRWARVGLATGAILLAAAASTGWPFTQIHHSEAGIDRCLMLVMTTGTVLVLIGFLSGAFVQRRGLSGVFWIAAGLSLVALNVVTWHCPNSGLMHVLPGHMGGAVMLMVAAVVVGLLSRRRDRPTP